MCEAVRSKTFVVPSILGRRGWLPWPLVLTGKLLSLASSFASIASDIARADAGLASAVGLMSMPAMPLPFWAVVGLVAGVASGLALDWIAAQPAATTPKPPSRAKRRRFRRESGIVGSLLPSSGVTPDGAAPART